MTINYRETFNPIILLGVNSDHTYINCIKALNAASTKDISYEEVDEVRVVEMIIKRVYQLFIDSVSNQTVYSVHYNYSVDRDLNRVVITNFNESDMCNVTYIQLTTNGLHGLISALVEGVIYQVPLKMQ